MWKRLGKLILLYKKKKKKKGEAPFENKLQWESGLASIHLTHLKRQGHMLCFTFSMDWFKYVWCIWFDKIFSPIEMLSYHLHLENFRSSS